MPVAAVLKFGRFMELVLYSSNTCLSSFGKRNVVMDNSKYKIEMLFLIAL